MDIRYNRLVMSPLRNLPRPEVVESDFDKMFVPDNSAIETMLTPNDDGSLPDISQLLKNPKYQQAFAEFAAQQPDYQSIVDTSQLSDEELASLIDNNSDFNDMFWKFYDSVKYEYETRNEK